MAPMQAPPMQTPAVAPPMPRRMPPKPVATQPQSPQVSAPPVEAGSQDDSYDQMVADMINDYRGLFQWQSQWRRY